MGFNWTSIENSFPVFREDEPPKESARKIHDYLYQLINELKYILQNLDTGNWNDTALKNFSAETVRAVAEDVNRLRGSVSVLVGRVEAAEDDIAEIGLVVSNLEKALQEAVERLTRVEIVASDNEKDIGDLQEATAGIGKMAADIETNAADIETLEGRAGTLEGKVQALQEAVQCDEEKTTVGAAGRPLYLVGEIYINGVLYGEGGT